MIFDRSTAYADKPGLKWFHTGIAEVRFGKGNFSFEWHPGMAQCSNFLRGCNCDRCIAFANAPHPFDPEEHFSIDDFLADVADGSADRCPCNACEQVTRQLMSLFTTSD